MSKTESFEIPGKSGEAYNFNVYPYPMTFNDFIGGVYIIAKVTDGHPEVVYFGETDNIDPHLKGHDKKEEIKSAGANHIALHRNASKEVRNKVMADLADEIKPSIS
ncbi:MAG: hypothetical protein CMQ05_05605 [Gammaproteobacteria bacterium]|uniref:GIY-YIG domain-containing protein n=1 Tax=OM182 bacterium MED-G24 TaxID=1986255 RepID=A0A2A5WIP8_9GAMM|nr:hypothetical protein [Gammaproteobacteria bacterium]PDH36173.1 MAG: hypothetical protein CNE99_10105 [OM182 bacterium MED-G24]RPG24134.1 MAG: hypothetical protein CBC10_012175 [Gammaproteobacteria bacterium TMED50]|tara:strand:+ start:515 stop:832 length:318 start_codon:yes stop_codon:yes gene_type:complete